MEEDHGVEGHDEIEGVVRDIESVADRHQMLKSQVAIVIVVRTIEMESPDALHGGRQES